MNTKELKEKLYRQVENLDDESALQTLYYVAVESPKLDNSLLDELTLSQVRRLERSLQFTDTGKTVPQDVAMKKLRLLIASSINKRRNSQMLEEPAAEYIICRRSVATNKIAPAKRLETAREEVRNGEVYTHAEVRQMAKAWRSK